MRREITYHRDLDGRLVRRVEEVIERCENGHEMTQENTRISGDRWVCRTCERARSRLHKRRKGGHKPQARFREKGET